MPVEKLKSKIKERENLLKNALDALVSSGDIREVQMKMVNAIGKAFNSDRCYFRIYDPFKKEYLNTDIEYRSSPDIKSINEVKTTKEVQIFFLEKAKKNKQPFTIKNTDEYIKKHNLEGSDLECFFKNLDIKSDYPFSVKDRENNIFYLILHYVKEPVILSNEDIDLIKTIAEQAANSINHIQLYEQAKMRADREKALREIISIISSTLDFKEIRKNLVTRLGKVLGGDLNVLYITDPETNKFVPVDKYSVYLSSNKVKSPVGMSIESYGWGDFFRKDGKEVVYSDVENFKKKYNLYGTKVEKFIKDYNIKSCLVIPVFYLNQLIGILSINYTKHKKIIEENETELVRMVAGQAGIAIHKTRLYEKLKRNNDRERFLSEIISTVKSSLDVQEITTLILRKVKEFYKIEKVIVCNHLIDKCKTLYGIDLNPNSEKENENFIEEKLCKNNKTNIQILIKDLSRKDCFNLKAKQVVLVPVKLKNDKMGNICLFAQEKKLWEKEDLNLLEKIADNVAIAIRDSGLYTKTRFMADVSHELKTPVAIIDAYANNLLNRQEYNAETVEKYLGTIKNNTIRITNIIENMIVLSRVESENIENINLSEKTNVKKLIENVVDALKSIADNKDIKFKTSCENSLYLTGNEVLLEQAVLNLVKNAVQYSDENTKVIIKAEQAGNEVQIAVQDYGPGISERDLKNIFKRFYRADWSRSRETGGTGLGLSITEKIAEVHKGRIEVKSEVCKGTEFKLVIPQTYT